MRKQKKVKEKKETQLKGDQMGRVEVKVEERTEEKVRSTVVDVDSVRATGGGGEEDEETEKEEEQHRWLLEMDRQDGEFNFDIIIKYFKQFKFRLSDIWSVDSD